ncbi:MAG: rhodanese-like domain-containing protein, partial [Angelakisella sp.]
MRSSLKKTALLLALTMLLGTFAACNGHTFVKGDSKLISAKELSAYAGKANVVLVDMQAPEEYAKGHMEGAVNIPSSEIVINVPVKNMLAGKKKIEKTMGANGISNDTTVVVYDTDKMSAARMLWSLFMYGHENVLVVDGGLEAIKAQGTPMSTAPAAPVPATFTAGEPSQNWLAKAPDVLAQVNAPKDNVVLLDVRSDEEYMAEGKIPTAIMMNYLTNYYADNTLKDVQTTQINYLQAGID